MSECKIYHNPRCSKSREALKKLSDMGIEPEVIEYLHSPLTANEVEKLIAMSQDKPHEFIRIKEKEFQEFSQIDLSNAKEIAKAISLCPKLMERPIVVKNNRAIIARPVEKLDFLIKR